MKLKNEGDGEIPSKSRKPLSRWKLFLLGIGFVFAGPAAGYGLHVYCSHQGFEGSPQNVGVSPDGVLHIAGAIDKDLSQMVHEAVISAKVPIRRIWLNSIGGVAEDADDIGRVLKNLTGVSVTEVPDRGTCQSACIVLLVTAPGKLRIAPTATLMFHAGAKRNGLATCGICGLLNTLTVALSSSTQTVDQARALLPASRVLSDKLPTLFAMCKVNPLDSRNGMVLFGLEFNGLREGTIEPESLIKWCPSS